MMKMISSTSSTSIIGVTLMSFESPVFPPLVIAMLFSYGFLEPAFSKSPATDDSVPGC